MSVVLEIKRLESVQTTFLEEYIDAEMLPKSVLHCLGMEITVLWT